MFNDLVNLYCSYSDLADYYFWVSRDWNHKEKFQEYKKLAKNIEEILKGMCEENE
jgi:hypothetical protein